MSERSEHGDLPRKGFLELMPRGSLFRVATLLLVLAAIVALQRNSGSVVQRLSDTLNIVSPPSAAPRVRMAPSEKRP